jgi:hypothetical protein
MIRNAMIIALTLAAMGTAALLGVSLLFEISRYDNRDLQIRRGQDGRAYAHEHWGGYSIHNGWAVLQRAHSCDKYLISHSMDPYYADLRYYVLGAQIVLTYSTACTHSRLLNYFVEVPLPMVFAVLIAYPTLTFIRGPLRRWRRRRQGLCVKCAYDLTGNESGVCPECGTATERGDSAIHYPQVVGSSMMALAGTE